MRLQRIYSSKLYLTSNRKDKIHAAIQDPINIELVQQLEEYLSDEAKAELKQAESQIKPEPKEDSDGQVIQPDTSDTSSSGGGGPSHSAFTGDILSDFGDDEFSDEGSAEGSSSEAPVEEAPVEETTSVKGKTIKATSVIWTSIEDISNECETIKGTLNAREDTKGVSRIEVKGSDATELWIYYNDDSNLNDKMIEVISVLNSTGYTYLKFNRLARSNNAIVFDVTLNAQEPIKTVKEVEDETK